MAALYQADVRLAVAAGVLLVFIATLPRPAPQPVSMAVICAIAFTWDFGATLIWGTAGPTKVRLDLVDSGRVGSWVLLVFAVVGIVSAASALRAFAGSKQMTGSAFAAVFAATFVLWSCAVRYSPVIAALGLIIAAGAFWQAATVEPDEQLTLAYADRLPRRRLTGLIWAGTVFVAVAAFSGWATNHLRHFGQSCPWGMPGEGQPVLIGSLTVVGTILIIALTRYRSHRPVVLVGLCAAAACVTGALELLAWVGVGVNHYCFD